ncbi:hypothetical protein EVAR_10899_1 [Eumeta japonica]|uniref:Uncharacterized protein n=1 Tax=Eumeta variegata TaxID=151549 RepID=A0A4C1URH7_EUMVA|nr:hypothetical protein EVAR_10899_1 [Eumeta japonica]
MRVEAAGTYQRERGRATTSESVTQSYDKLSNARHAAQLDPAYPITIQHCQDAHICAVPIPNCKLSGSASVQTSNRRREQPAADRRGSGRRVSAERENGDTSAAHQCEHCKLDNDTIESSDHDLNMNAASVSNGNASANSELAY